MACCLTPPRSRLVDAVEDHFRLNERHYLGHSGIMTGIHVEPVTSNHGYVVEMPSRRCWWDGSRTMTASSSR
jgi:hypothetical protein